MSEPRMSFLKAALVVFQGRRAAQQPLAENAKTKRSTDIIALRTSGDQKFSNAVRLSKAGDLEGARDSAYAAAEDYKHVAQLSRESYALTKEASDLKEYAECRTLSLDAVTYALNILRSVGRKIDPKIWETLIDQRTEIAQVYCQLPDYASAIAELKKCLDACSIRDPKKIILFDRIVDVCEQEVAACEREMKGNNNGAERYRMIRTNLELELDILGRKAKAEEEDSKSMQAIETHEKAVLVAQKCAEISEALGEAAEARKYYTVAYIRSLSAAEQIIRVNADWSESADFGRNATNAARFYVLKMREHADVNANLQNTEIEIATIAKIITCELACSLVHNHVTDSPIALGLLVYAENLILELYSSDVLMPAYIVERIKKALQEILKERGARQLRLGWIIEATRAFSELADLKTESGELTVGQKQYYIELEFAAEYRRQTLGYQNQALTCLSKKEVENAKKAAERAARQSRVECSHLRKAVLLTKDIDEKIALLGLIVESNLKAGAILELVGLDCESYNALAIETLLGLSGSYQKEGHYDLARDAKIKAAKVCRKTAASRHASNCDAYAALAADIEREIF